MRQLSRIAINCIFFLSFLFGISAAFGSEIPEGIKKIPDCSAVAVFKYKPTDGPIADCKIVIDRSAPGSPLPIQVRSKTRVYVYVKSQQGNEIIQAVVTNDAVAKPDIAGGLISKLTIPLASLQFTEAYNNARARPPLVADSKQTVQQQQEDYYTNLKTVYTGYVEANCLQMYVRYDGAQTACTTNPIAGVSEFEIARKSTARDIKTAIDANLPDATKVSILDGDVDDTCPDDTYPETDDCFKIKANQITLDVLSGSVAARNKSTTLQSYLAALTMWQRTADTLLPVYQQPTDHRLTIKINGIEQIAGTTTAIASVVVTWQQTNWSLSTGVVLSALKNKTFADSPIYNADGTPETDGTGKTYTQVTVAKTYPGIISPVFLVNYRLYNFQGNSGRFAILFSAGLGANIITKSADFAAGPSLQWGSVIFSPVVHYGRQTQLTGGVHVGDELGTSPPALPTVNLYKPAVGLAVTYHLPLP